MTSVVALKAPCECDDNYGFFFSELQNLYLGSSFFHISDSTLFSVQSVHEGTVFV